MNRENILNRIARETKGLDPVDALVVINRELESCGDCAVLPFLEVNKTRCLRELDQWSEAIASISEAAKRYSSDGVVRYAAGEIFVEAGQYSVACIHLDAYLNNECEPDGEWFVDCAYLLRAYCAARLGETEKSRLDLDKIADDTALFWLRTEFSISKDSVLKLIDS